VEFSLSEEQRILQQTMRQFARQRLLPNYARWDRGETVGREEIREIAELGILALGVPEKFGGQVVDYVTVGIIAEELSRGDFNYSTFIQLGLIAAGLLAFAHPEVQAEWLPRLATGDATIAFGLTEPGAGSDAANITCRAVRMGDDYVISGEKA
jgi:cyclohexanecarboxyl-CoA dehydrogenase